MLLNWALDGLVTSMHTSCADGFGFNSWQRLSWMAHELSIVIQNWVASWNYAGISRLQILQLTIIECILLALPVYNWIKPHGMVCLGPNMDIEQWVFFYFLQRNIATIVFYRNLSINPVTVFSCSINRVQ